MMENKEFGRQLEKRTKDLAINIIKLSIKLPLTAEAKVIKNQLTKSGTSIGAKYREANRSRSKADFKNKIKICVSEASETGYWLEIISCFDRGYPEIVEQTTKESSEILAILTSTEKKLNL